VREKHKETNAHTQTHTRTYSLIHTFILSVGRPATDALRGVRWAQLYSASLDGTLRLWDYDDAVVLKVRPARVVAAAVAVAVVGTV
jgi:preprotein translocase subunit Sec61beta